MWRRKSYNGTLIKFDGEASMNDLTLVIGNKNYSSWSLRPWFFLRKNKLPFTEQQLWLYVPEFKPAISAYNSGGKVPVLIDGDEEIWDSLAIIDTLIDRYDCQYGWPEAPRMRAHARSAACEMHAGFMALREQCPMVIHGKHSKNLSAETLKDIQRISDLWTQAMAMSGDQTRWLYGDFSAADAMFAPVVFRLQSYDVKVSAVVRRYMDFVLSDVDLSAWIEDAGQETRNIA